MDGYRWRDLFGKLSRYRNRLLLAQIAAIASALMAVPVPLLIPAAVEEVLLGHPGWLTTLLAPHLPDRLRPYEPILTIAAVLILSVLLRLLALALTAWQTEQFLKISKSLIFELRGELLRRLRGVALSAYETLGSGQVTARLTTDLDTLDLFLGQALGRAAASLFLLIGTGAILLWLSWPLALLILTLQPLVLHLTRRLGERVKRLKRRENAAVERFQEALIGTLDALPELRISGQERHYFDALVEEADRLRREAAEYSFKSDLLSRLSFLLFLHGVDLFRATAMVAVLLSQLTLGEMLAIFGYLWFLMNPTQELLNLYYSFYSAQAALERINRLFRLERERRHLPLLNPFVGRKGVAIALEGVHFSYGRDPVICDLTLEVAPGEKIALVGESGSGKSTLVQLLVGLYPPQRGTICYGGVPLEQIGLEVVRENVAVVRQHPFLLNDTLRANLTLGRDLPEGELWEALEIAQLREVVQRLPQGVDTVVGRGGMRLSGGQRQRLAIARAILRRPKVVILDEATSALDRKTERRLLEALDHFLEGRTAIIVAHRPSAIERVDRICVLEGGRIVEEGHLGILARRKGLFGRLYGERLGGT